MSVHCRVEARNRGFGSRYTACVVDSERRPPANPGRCSPRRRAPIPDTVGVGFRAVPGTRSRSRWCRPSRLCTDRAARHRCVLCVIGPTMIEAACACAAGAGKFSGNSTVR
jgi:hypothetical protein